MSPLSFICHSSQDAEIANKIVEKLEEAGLPCWIAPRDIPQGLTYAAQIVQGLRNSNIMIFIFTKSSNNSDAVINEIEKALSLKIPVIPFKLVNDDYSDSLEYYLRTKQSANAWDKSLDAAVSELIKHIRSTNVSQTEHAPLPTSQPPQITVPPHISGNPVKKSATIKYALIALAVIVAIFLFYKFIPSKNNSEDANSPSATNDSAESNNQPAANDSTESNNHIYVATSSDNFSPGEEGQLTLEVFSDINNKIPLADASVTIECNAGTFKNGTLTETGTTDANGTYKTLWRSPTSTQDIWGGKYTISKEGFNNNIGTFTFPIKN